MSKRRVHGTLSLSRGDGPTFVSSCSNLFAKRGDEWLTPREKDKEYPLRRSLLADEPNSAEQLRISDIRRTMKQDKHKARMIKVGAAITRAVQAGDNKLAIELTEEFVRLRETIGDATIDAKPPQPRIVVDPDMDMYTKATRAEERKETGRVQGKATETDPQRKAAAALLSMRRNIRASGCIELKRQAKAGHKVKGSFYRFEDIGDKVQDSERHPPRPFLGITPPPKARRRKRGKK